MNEPTRITRSYHPKHHLTFTPNAQHLIYARFRGDRMTLMVVCVDGSHCDAAGERILIENSADYVQQHPALSPDGLRLIYTGNVGYRTGAIGLYICDMEPGTLQCSRVQPLVTGMQAQMATWSPDGRRIVFAAYRGTATAHLYLLTIDRTDASLPTGKPIQLTNLAGFAVQPSWSPDGQWIAFSSTTDGNYEIYKVRPEGRELTRLTDHPFMDCRPTWSPDAKWIAFISNRDANYEVYRMRADGSGTENLTQHPALDDHVAWFPDGGGIAFVSTRDGGFDIYRASLADFR